VATGGCDVGSRQVLRVGDQWPSRPNLWQAFVECSSRSMRLVFDVATKMMKISLTSSNCLAYRLPVIPKPDSCAESWSAAFGEWVDCRWWSEKEPEDERNRFEACGVRYLILWNAMAWNGSTKTFVVATTISLIYPGLTHDSKWSTTCRMIAAISWFSLTHNFEQQN